MAGMGGLVMGRILQEGATVAAAARRILLQPQGNLPELRAFLYENGYCVQDEAIVLDNGRYYQLILAAKGAPPPAPAGPRLLGAWTCGLCKGRAPAAAPCQKYRAGHQKRLDKALKKGYTPQALVDACQALDTIIEKLEEPHAAM